MTKYKDYKQWNEARTQEVNQFVELNCIFAFGRDQLQEALKEHNLTEKEFENIYNEIRACGTVAEHLAENLENIPFTDLRGRLENLRDLLAETLEKYQSKAAEVEQ